MAGNGRILGGGLGWAWCSPDSFVRGHAARGGGNGSITIIKLIAPPTFSFLLIGVGVGSGIIGGRKTGLLLKREATLCARPLGAGPTHVHRRE